MADVLVADWMEEFESLTESEIHTYSTEQEHNHEVMIAIYNILSEPAKFKAENVSRYPDHSSTILKIRFISVN